MHEIRTYGWTKARWNEEPLLYCTKCGSLNIKGEGKTLHCDNCHSHPKYLDVTNIYRYMQWYEESFGHSPLAKEPDRYDDLREVYDEQAVLQLTEGEAFDNGLNVGDYINRNLHEK